MRKSYVNWLPTPLNKVLEERTEISNPSDIELGLTPIISKIRFDTGKIELRETGKTRTKMILIRPGDLVLSGINAAKGAIAICEEKMPLSATIHYSSYKPKSEKVNILFLWYFLRSEVFRDILRDNVPGGIKTELKPKRFLPIKIPLPSLKEQQRIVARIEKLTAKIEEARRLRAESVGEAQLLVVSARYNLIFPEKANNWKTLLFNQAVDKPRGPNAGLPKKEYKSSGKFPVIDQGKEYIGGYTDDESRVFKVVAPVIVWGDHTTNSKLVDFDFVPGADGTKIFSPKEELLARYVNQFLKTVNYPEMGYSRHYRHLKKQQIPVPPLPKQRRIVDYLDKLQSQLDKLRKYQVETQKEIDALTQSILSQAFRGKL